MRSVEFLLVNHSRYLLLPDVKMTVESVCVAEPLIRTPTTISVKFTTQEIPKIKIGNLQRPKCEAFGRRQADRFSAVPDKQSH